MHTVKLNDHVQLIDLELGGIKNFLASYVLKGRYTGIIETGPASTAGNLLSSLKELNIDPKEVTYVAASHIHLDHAGAAGALLRHLPKAKLIVHWRGGPHVVDPEKLWTQSRAALGSIAEEYGRPEPVPKDRVVAATDGMIFNLGDEVRLRAIETLGHASHHLTFYETSGQGVFTGDAAGIYLGTLDVVVPTMPRPCRLDMALASLEKLIALKPACLYFSHFGRAIDAHDKLRAYVRQLRLWADIAKEGIEKGESHKLMCNRILERDGALRKAEQYIRDHPILRKTVFNQSVEGIAKFVEKYGNLTSSLNK